MALGPKDGVLLIAHGTVSDLDDLPEFVRIIRHGRPASDELVAELRKRYEAIGGSPLLEITRAQGQALARRLEAPVLVGMRLWRPSVAEVLRAATGLGLTRMVAVALAPFSAHVYRQAAELSRSELESEIGAGLPALVHAAAWGSEPLLIEAHAAQIRPALEKTTPAETSVILTAHSLPQRVIDAGDPYQRGVEAAARAVASALGWPVELAFQSQGMDGGAWLLPDLKATLERVARAGQRAVVVAPIGFLADHVETLYDLDIEAASWARDHGLAFSRVPALNLHPGLISALERVVTRALANGSA
jgi:protoporphyrin/coproporphyrin ferrochelatase